jgi:hypothetical protein
MMAWASKFNEDDEVIECALNKVDLYHQEQNDAPRIVQLVADGDIETALERIEKFGGEDKEGLQRKFILYMLCVMELTLLESKEHSLRKKAVEKLLINLEKEIPVGELKIEEFLPTSFLSNLNQNILLININFNFSEDSKSTSTRPHFFSDELDDLKIKYKYSEFYPNELYNLLTDDNSYNNSNELIESLTFNSFDLFQIIFSIRTLRKRKQTNKCIYLLDLLYAEAWGIYDDTYYQSILIMYLCIEYVKVSEIDKSFENAFEIVDEEIRNKTFGDMCLLLALNENFKSAIGAFNSIYVPNYISVYDSSRLSFRNNILVNLTKIAHEFRYSNEMYSFILDEITESCKLVFFREYLSLCVVNKSYDIAKQVILDFLKFSQKQNNNQQTLKNKIINDYLDSKKINFIEKLIDLEPDITKKCKQLIVLSDFFIFNNDYSSADSKLRIADRLCHKISDQEERIDLYLKISRLYKLINNSLLSKIKIDSAIENTKSLVNPLKQILLTQDIAYTLTFNGDVENAYELICEWGSEETEDYLIESITKIFKILIETKQLDKAEFYINNGIVVQNQDMFKSPFLKCLAALTLSDVLFKDKEYKKSNYFFNFALEVTENIKNDFKKTFIYENICIQYCKQEKFDLAINFIEKINITNINGEYHETFKNRIYSKIFENISFTELDKAYGFLQDHKNTEGLFLEAAFSAISAELAKNGKLEEALTCVEGISDKGNKCNALKNISYELAKQGKQEDAATVMQQALAWAEGISNDWQKSTALIAISSELAKQGKLEEAATVMQFALACSEKICDKSLKSIVSLTISAELVKQGNYTLAEQAGSKIPLITQRQKCWKEIAQILKEQLGWKKSLNLYKEFKGGESIVYYLKGWTEYINIEDISEELVQKATPVLKDDNESLVQILQLYAIHQLIFESPAAEKINRYNRTLNLQWAIDIKNQLPN